MFLNIEKWNKLTRLIGLLIILFFFNEFIIYYIFLLQCQWPLLQQARSGDDLKVMLLADTHILGEREGHWFDKLRREWQMERSFQTAMTIHSPEVVFILGDLFDEGKWSNDVEFKTYLDRFHQMFRHSPNTKLYATVGNHDIGFHYMINPHNRKRFENAFNAPSIRMLRLKRTIFVLANSMAFEGDGCDMCTESEKLLNEIGRKLDCAQDGNKYLDCHDITESFQYSKPILLQHFPMFRKSDWNCSGVDAAPLELRHKSFRQKHDCLSKEASDQLFNTLKPRLIVSGHIHHGCLTYHSDGTPEYTVASFNWRNKANSPSFLLARINQKNYAISKCQIPSEILVIWIYAVAAIILSCWILWPLFYYIIYRRRRKFL